MLSKNDLIPEESRDKCDLPQLRCFDQIQIGVVLLSHLRNSHLHQNLQYGKVKICILKSAVSCSLISQGVTTVDGLICLNWHRFDARYPLDETLSL